MAETKQPQPPKTELEQLRAENAELKAKLEQLPAPKPKGELVSGEFLVVKPCFRQGRLWNPGQIITLEKEKKSSAMVPVEKHAAKAPVVPSPHAGRPNDKPVA